MREIEISEKRVKNIKGLTAGAKKLLILIVIC